VRDVVKGVEVVKNENDCVNKNERVCKLAS